MVGSAPSQGSPAAAADAALKGPGFPGTPYQPQTRTHTPVSPSQDPGLPGSPTSCFCSFRVCGPHSQPTAQVLGEAGSAAPPRLCFSLGVEQVHLLLHAVTEMIGLLGSLPCYPLESPPMPSGTRRLDPGTWGCPESTAEAPILSPDLHGA